MKSWIRTCLLLLLSFGLAFAILSSLPKQGSDVEPTAPQNTDLTLVPDPEGTVATDWRILRGLSLNGGETSAELKALDGKIVKIPGYMVPLDDYQSSVTEFLLVPSAQACIHVPPPPANQMVYVKMKSKSETPVTRAALWAVGTLKLEPSSSPYGRVAFTMEGLGVRPYKRESR